MKKKRKGRGAHKGGQFERDVCTQLSRWMSNGRRDDLFWRSAGSGARATVRAKRGKKTANQCGDICATDPLGKPLMDVVAIELKRGYSKFQFSELLDKPAKAKQQTWEAWLEQAVTSMENAGIFAWMLIVKRDRRETLCFMPDYLEEHLTEHGATFPKIPYIRFRARVRFSKETKVLSIVGT